MASDFIKKWEDFENQKAIYTIGVDCTFDKVKSYCLSKTVVGKSTEIILTNSVVEDQEFRSEKSEFQKEVENLAKYFNAKIIGD